MWVKSELRDSAQQAGVGAGTHNLTIMNPILLPVRHGAPLMVTHT